MDLSGLWEFKLGDYETPGDNCERLAGGERIAVPASYNDQKDDPAYKNHYGWAWYEREVTVPAFFKGQRLFLRFDAVTHRARIYINGTFVMEHKGGFLPFELELTELVVPGETLLLTVAADNRISHSTLPVGNEGGTAFFGSDNPGVPSVEAAKVWRKQGNLPNFDFFNYAGINRPVRLYTTPVSRICGLTLIPDIDDTDGILQYEAETEGEGAVHVEIFDVEGNKVAEAEGASGTITIPDARLWWPWPGTP